MRIGVALAMCAACGRDPAHPADAPAGDAAQDSVPADAYIPTESHALGVNDISFLLQLPVVPTYTATLVAMTGFPGGTELVPRPVFASLVTAPGDVASAYEEFHAVAVRFDLCDRVTATPCADGQDGRLRIVFQPVSQGVQFTQADDVGLHAFYAIPAADLGPVVNELRALARLYDFQTASPLAVNQALNANAPPSQYSKRLTALVAKYARADNLVRLTLMAHTTGAWVFRGVEGNGGTFQPITIPVAGNTEQRVVQANFFDVSPIADVPAGFQLALQKAMFDSSAGSQQQLSLSAVAEAQNPTMYGFSTEQCASCHLAATVMTQLSTDVGVAPSSIAGTYTSSHDVSTIFSASGSLHGLGWLGQYPTISQRVANESALVLDEIDARFPPATTMPPIDAGMVDSPPNVKRVFVAKLDFNGDLKTAGGGSDGLDGADKLCTAAAARGHLGGGPWVAWLTTSTVNAIDRVTGNGPWYLVDGTTLVFANQAALASTPSHPIDHDETGGIPITSYSVWTGAAGHTCADWTDSTSASTAMTGVLDSATASWASYGNIPCNSPYPHIYCFEQ